MMSKFFLVLVAVIGIGLTIACVGAQPQTLEDYFSNEEIKYMKPHVVEALNEMIAERNPQTVQNNEQDASKLDNKEKQQPCLAISYLNQPEKPTDLKAKVKANVEYQCRFCCRDNQFKFSYTTWDAARHCRCTDSLLRKMFGVIEFDASS